MYITGRLLLLGTIFQFRQWLSFRTNQILCARNYCHHPWCVGDKSYRKALLIMFTCDGMSDHASRNEDFHYWDTKLSWIKTPYQTDNKPISDMVMCYKQRHCLLEKGPMKALFQHATFGHFFIRHVTFRQNFAWHRHSKFSPPLDILLSKALKKLVSANLKKKFSSLGPPLSGYGEEFQPNNFDLTLGHLSSDLRPLNLTSDLDLWHWCWSLTWPQTLIFTPHVTYVTCRV